MYTAGSASNNLDEHGVLKERINSFIRSHELSMEQDIPFIVFQVQTDPQDHRSIDIATYSPPMAQQDPEKMADILHKARQVANIANSNVFPRSPTKKPAVVELDRKNVTLTNIWDNGVTVGLGLRRSRASAQEKC